MSAPSISTFSQSFPPKPTWPLSNIPDLSGKVIVVTGGNSGIGYETVLELIRHKAKVYLAARSKSRADSAIEELLKQPDVNGSIEFVHLDLGDLRSIEAFAQEMSKRVKQIDLLFNNAGVLLTEIGGKTAQGYEPHIGINALGTQYVTELLLPLLKAGGAAHPDYPTRVVFTSSYMHIFTIPDGFDPQDPVGDNAPQTIGISKSLRRYSISKFCNILSARRFQRDYGNNNIVFTSVHPGAVRTNLANDSKGVLAFIKDYLVYYTLLITAKQGAYTQLYAGFGPDGLIGGAYFVPYGREAATLPKANDIQVQDTFVRWCNEQIAKSKAT